jgi:hypothetical protein
MSVPDVATLVNLRGLVPRVASAEAPTVLVRWMLRLATVVIFGVATAIGVSLALAAPTESPASLSEPRR